MSEWVTTLTLTLTLTHTHAPDRLQCLGAVEVEVEGSIGGSAVGCRGPTGVCGTLGGRAVWWGGDGGCAAGGWRVGGWARVRARVMDTYKDYLQLPYPSELGSGLGLGLALGLGLGFEFETPQIVNECV